MKVGTLITEYFSQGETAVGVILGTGICNDITIVIILMIGIIVIIIIIIIVIIVVTIIMLLLFSIIFSITFHPENGKKKSVMDFFKNISLVFFFF